MPSSQGSITDQNPIDSASGVANSEHGTKVISVNMKNTAKFLRSQISRSFTTASKKLDAAKVYLNDPDVNRTDRDLRIIDMLQKEIMMILSIIETDAHFFDVIKTRDVILSDKERAALKDVVINHFAKKPRDETIEDLKTAQAALRQILISQEYRFESQISEAELAELSHNLDSFLVGDDDDNENNGDDIADNGDQEVPRLSPVTENTPILTSGSPPTFQNTAVITLSPSNENGGFVYNSDQPVVPPLIQQVRLSPREPLGPQPAAPPLIHQARLPPKEPFELQPVRDTNEQHANRPSPPLMEKMVRSCPCCEENHELFRCTNEYLQRYCALNKRCIYCTSNEHKSIECDLVSHKSSHAPSIVSQRSHRSEIESCVTPPLEASTPYGCGKEKTDQSGIASCQDQTKELPSSIMTLDASSTQNLRQKKQSTDNANKFFRDSNETHDNQHASSDDLSSMDACLMSSGRKLKDDNTSPLSNEKAGLMSSGHQPFNSNHASRNRLASNDDLSSKDACLMSSGRKPLDDVTSPLSDNSMTRKFTNDRAMPVSEAAGLMSSGRQLKLQSSTSSLKNIADNSVIPVGMNEPRLSGRHPTAHHKASRTGGNSKEFSRREPSRIASSLVNANSVSSVPGPLIEVNTDEVIDEAKDSTSEAGLMSSGRQPEVLPTHARLMPPGRKHGGVNKAGLMSSGRQPNNNKDHDSIDEAFARLPANRLRPYQARKAKTRIKHYTHVVNSGGPQIPQSVVNLQGPRSL
ncbi:unnamed protein product [Caenorhabditis brenneri]